MTKRKLWPLLAILLCVGALLTVLHRNEPEASAPQHTLRVALWDYDAVSYNRKVIEQFELEHPDIHIEVIAFSPAYYNDSLSAMLDSGERVDVIFVNQLDQLSALLESDVALPLDTLVQRDAVALDSYPDMTPLRDPKSGELLALPYRKDKFVLYYNKDLFDLAGMTYPTDNMTWAEFQNTATELSRRLKCIDEAYWGAYFLKKEKHLFYFLQSEPFRWDTDPFSKVYPGLELLLSMQKSGAIPPFTHAAMAQDSQRLFELGYYGMFVHGSWYMNFLAEDEADGLIDFDWGVAERPVWSADTPNRNDAWITPVVIHRETTEPEAAWEFLKYACGEKGAALLAGEMILPALSSSAIEQTLQTALQKRGISPLILQNFSDPAVPPDYQQQALINAVYDDYARALLSLNTIDQSILSMEQTRAELLT